MDKRYGILIVSVTFLVLCFVVTASATNWSVDGSGGVDFTGIQDAINDAKDGDSIMVHSGIYYENVVVDKSVTLKGIGHPVVDAGGEGCAITLTADGITLVGFNAKNSGSTMRCAGIKVTSNNNTITGNNVSKNNEEGISIYDSSNNIITGNNVSSNNGVGIRLYYFSNNNTITGNNVSNNNDEGISLSSSGNNTITGNNVSNNNRGGIILYGSSNNNTIAGNVFVNDGLSVYFSYQNTVEDNTVNGKPLVYLEDVSDYKVEDAGQVIIVNCNNISIENLDLSNTRGGIALWKTENSKISNNTVCNNNRGGIRLYYSSNNSITGNNVCSNGVGISLYYSSDNKITGNNVCNNNWSGIRLGDSSNNTITSNNVSNNNNRDGIFLHSSNNNTIAGNVFLNDGLSVYSSYQNTAEDNTVNGKPLVYLEDVSDYKVENAGQVILINCSNISVENLDLSNTSIGVELLKTRNSRISNNTVCNNWNGIHLQASNYNNNITGNNVSNNEGGIALWHSSNNNTITGNNVSNNDEGIYLWHSSNNIVTGNNVHNNNDDGIHLSESSNNSITGNNISNNNEGILLYPYSNNNTITGNNVCNNNYGGIDLSYYSNNNTITGNNLSSNEEGIRLRDSNNNKIYFNNFIHNTYSVKSQSSTTIWNSPLEMSYTYDGNAYTNYLGNYWDDYEGTDADGDGIGDTNYSIDSEKDESDDYPLMKPFENYIT